MIANPLLPAVLGGASVGAAALGLFLANGRVLGVSGILAGVLRGAKLPPAERRWRAAFLGGMLAGALALRTFLPGTLEPTVSRSPLALVVAGLLVGYGTRLGGGCTSGHGICGVARLSSRSLVATVVFVTAGMVTVFAIRHWLGGRP